MPETDRRGYYGLIEKPSFEEALGWARNPLKIPLPDRHSSKWYALSPFRAAILDAENKFQDFEHAVHDYRQSGNELPEKAAHVDSSAADQDPSFDRMNEQAEKRDDLDWTERAKLAHEYNERRSAREERHEDLGRRSPQGRKNAVLQNDTSDAIHFSFGTNHEEDPGSYGALRNRKSRLVGKELPQAAGRPMIRQIPSFREANGQRMDLGMSAAVRPGEDESYESMRRMMN